MLKPPDGFGWRDDVWIREWDVWDVEVITDSGVHITRRDLPDPRGIPGDKLIGAEPSGHTVEITYLPSNYSYRKVYVLRYNNDGYLYDLPYISDYWISKYRDLMDLCYKYPDKLSGYLPDIIRFLHEYDTIGEEVMRL